MNKKLLFVAVIFVFQLTSCTKDTIKQPNLEITYDNFSCTPLKPQPNQEITVFYKPMMQNLYKLGPMGWFYCDYSPAGTIIQKAEQINMLVYQFHEDTFIPVLKEIRMQNDGEEWSAKFTPSDSTVFLNINFQLGDFYDVNNRAGYYIILYDQGNNFFPGMLTTMSQFYSSFCYYIGLKPNKVESKKLIEMGMELFPTQKSRFLPHIWRTKYQNFKHRKVKKKILKELKKVASKEVLDYHDKSLLTYNYSFYNKKKEAEKYKKEIFAEYPKSRYVKWERIGEMRQEKNIDIVFEQYKQFYKDFPPSYHPFETHAVTWDLSQKVKRSENFKKYNHFLNNVIVSPRPSLYLYFCNDIFKSDKNINDKIMLVKDGIAFARAELKSNDPYRPRHITIKQRREALNSDLLRLLNIYGYGLCQIGEAKNSIPIFEEAIELSKLDDYRILVNYSRALLKAGFNDQAFEFVTRLIESDTFVPDVDKLFCDSYSAVFNSSIEKSMQAYKNLVKSKEEISRPAPAISFLDIDGNRLTFEGVPNV